MIFYVYFDPQIIAVARENGDLGLQALIGILYDLLQNCFIAEFQNYQVQEGIRDHINDLPETYDRAVIKKIVAQLEKHNRFIYCLVPDYSGEKDILGCVKEQAVEALLDLLLLVEVDEDFVDIEGAEAATLFNYQHTQFARDRSKISCEGVVLSDSAHNEQDFLNKYLKKALRHASLIEICDKLLGEKYRGNYEYTVSVLFSWLEGILADPANCKIIIHCGVPDDEARDIETFKAQLRALKQRGLAGITFKLCLYKNDRGSDALPHDRFIVTDQIAIGLPRGMDFLNRATRKNRDLTLDYKSADQVNSLIGSYSVGKQPDIDL
jgi:hypothetical protein